MKTFTGFSKPWKLLLLVFPMVGSFAQAQVIIDVPQSIKTFRAEQASADSVIVVYRDDAGVSKKSASSKAYRALEAPRKVLEKPVRAKKGAVSLSRAAKRMDNMYVAKVRKGVSVETAVAEAQQDPQVLYAEPNYRVQMLAAPNDPRYEWLYTLNNTGQVVHALSQTGLYERVGTVDADMDWIEAYTNATFPTNEIIVAVVDTGVDYTHPDITNRMWRNTAETVNGLDDDSNGYVDDIYGIDTANGDSDPKDDNGHGTHCAGTIAAEGNNTLGIIGVNPYARIMAVKFLEANGGGSSVDAIGCITYAVDMGAKVLNNSWGGGAWVQALQDAVDYATENGVVFMAAAGNSNVSTPSYPAAYNGAVAVASLNCEDKKSGFSNYGNWVDVAAHGSDILSLRADGTSLWSPYVVDTNYVVFQGTSMACPNAAGAMSLLVSLYPGYSPLVYERVMRKTADTNIYLINTNYPALLGAGRVNVNRLVNEPVEVGYIDTRWAAPVNDAKVGYTNIMLVSAGVWNTPMSNLTVTATNLTTGISVSSNLVNIGDLPAGGSVALPTNTFVVTVSPTATNEIVQVQFVLRSGTQMLHTVTHSLYLFQGNATYVAVDDLDADGTNDLAAVYVSVVMRYDQDGRLLWFDEPINGNQAQAFRAIATGDIDGDGYKEIVLAAENILLLEDYSALHVYRHDGTLQPGFPVAGSDLDEWRGFNELTLADVDEDGADEIICTVTSADGERQLRAYKGDGSLLWKKPLNHLSYAPAAAGDMDGDGYPEIVVCSYNNTWYTHDTATVHVVKGDGTTLAEWGVPDGFTITGRTGEPYAPIALGDLDGDGDLEITMSVVKDGGNNTNRLYAWHHDGAPVAGWPKHLKDTIRFYEPPALADVNGDGQLEVFSTHYFNEIEGWQADGTSLPAFPVPYTNGYPNLLVDDLTGDGSAELLLRGFQSYADRLYAFHTTNGQPVAGWNPLWLDDDDPVGINDFVLTTLGAGTNRYLVTTVGTRIRIMNTTNAYSPLPLSWPMHRQNPQRTGLCEARAAELFRCSFDTPQRYGVSNLTASFTAYPIGFDATNCWYRWDFDNNGSADLSSFGISTAVYAYAAIGDYTVKLTVSNATGNVFTRTRTNYVHVLAPVVADFTVNIQTAEAPMSLQFTDLSQNTPTSWHWDFGDYNTSTHQNPEHYYTDSGTYTVTLTVQNDFGANGSSSNTIVKTAYISLTNDASTMVKYVSPGGLGIYPYKNWREAATNLQDAIDATLGGQTVLVTNGVYNCDDAPDLEYSIERNNITLRSVNGPESTIIHGRGLEFGNQFSALYINGATGTVVDGFTLERGTYYEGGGISCESADRTRIENCIFRDNSSAEAGLSGGYGGGMWATRNVTIRNSVFERNAAYRGAALFLVTDSLTQTALVENCVFRDNGGDWRSQLGSAIAVDGASFGKHIVRNCQITGNAGTYSIIYSQPAIEIDGCTIADNRTMYSGSGILQTHNASHGEALNATSGTWTVRNTILALNEGAATYTTGGPGIQFSYSCLTQTVAGTGNFTNTPKFSGIPGDYHLAHNSPCRDAGQNQSWMSSTNDLYGDSPRIVNTTADTGCDEFDLGAVIYAAPTSGPAPLAVAFSSTVVSVSGTVTNYTWVFGDGAVSNGAALSAVSHTYTNLLGDFIATLVIRDTAGRTATSGIRIIVDGTGPHLTGAQAVNSAQVKLFWDEPVAVAGATNLSNYSVLSGFTVVNAGLEAGSRSVMLTVTPAFAPGVTNQVTASGVQDIYGNAMSGIETQAFVYVDAATYGIRVDIGYGLFKAEGNWNHINGKTVGDYVTNAVDAAGNITEVDISITDEFPFINYSDGVESSALYPTNAQKDGLYGTLADPGKLEIRQLNPDVRYDLILFGSVKLTNKETLADTAYMVNGQTNVVDAYMNTSNTANFYSLAPDTNGTLLITVSGSNSADFGYINVLEIRRGSPILLLSTNRLVIPENSTAQLTARLSVTPDNTVTVEVANVAGDANIQMASAAILTFTPLDWDQPQTVTLGASQDGDWLDGTATVRFVSAQMPAVDLECTEDDSDTNPAHLLPFSETFENESPMAGTPGPVHDQHGWESASTNAAVQSAVKHGGAQALRIADAEVWHPFATAVTNVSLSFYAMPQFRAEADSTVSNVAVHFYVWTNGQVVAYSNTAPVVLNVQVASNVWSLFEIECDYAAQQWNLRVNGTNAAAGFGFYSPQSRLTRFELREGSETVSYLDDLSVFATPVGDDADSDGLPDSWEEFYYGSNAPSPTDLCANGVNTVRDSYIAGFDPTYTNAGFGVSNVRNLLWWNAASGRVYTVYWSSNLLNGFQTLETNFTGGVFTDALHGTVQKSFYKIEVRLDP